MLEMPLAGHPLEGVEQIYTAQSLFTIYVHHTPSRMHMPLSIFTGRGIPDLVNTTNGYGQHVLVKVSTSRTVLTISVQGSRGCQKKTLFLITSAITAVQVGAGIPPL